MYALSDISNDLFCLVIVAIIFACHLQSTSTRQSIGLFRGMVVGMMALVGGVPKEQFCAPPRRQPALTNGPLCVRIFLLQKADLRAWWNW